MKKSKRKSENTLRQMEIKTQYSKIMGCSKGSSMREVYTDISLPQARKISSKQPNITPKRIRKGRANKVQSEQKDFFGDGHSDQCEVIPHCSFDLHFSKN